MEVSLIHRTDLGTGQLERLDPEFVGASILATERGLARMGAKELAISASVNDGTRYREGSFDDDARVNYIDLDAVQDGDGLALPDILTFPELPDRAYHRVRLNDILVANVRPNRGAVA